MSVSTPQICGTAGGVDPDPEAAGFSPSRLQRLSAILRADADNAAIPGAVTLIMRDGKLAYFDAVGYAERKTLRPMQRNSVFRIASMTKPLTVAAALMLMEQGKLLLTDPVSRYLPQLREVTVGVEEVDPSTGQRRLTQEPCRRPMTVHDLMRHTAGFTYGQFGDSLVQRSYRAAQLMDSQQTNAEMLAKLAELPLAYQPGTTFEYGMSTDVLGHVVEVVSGMGLDRFFAEYITEPLGMLDTAFAIPPGDRHRLAEPQREAVHGSIPALMPNDPALPAKWCSGGGGLLSTAGDYARFSQMLLNGGELGGVRLLARKSVQLMTQNHLPATLNYGRHTAELGVAAPILELGQGYGLGLGVRMQAGLSPVPGSSGDFYWGGALGPYFWADPAEKLTVVFMLQELNVQVRTRYRALLRALVYQALR
ncbi:MAG: serine hydrolase domain-containing protein [Steroidobacteraceae bacterium]|jgi:CubicO group peptidase (beta-lactamase class C family)